MLDLRSEYGPDAHPITIAGITGPKGDAYKPEEAPPFAEAGAFHRSQIDELCDSGVDLLIAKTLPAFDEARAIAAGMVDSGLPYVLSFVLRRDGTLLDGTPLETAIRRIDSEITRPPDCYFVNCVHASVFGAAMTALAARDPRVARRVRGLDANTSAKTPEELDGLEELDTESPEDFGRQV